MGMTSAGAGAGSGVEKGEERDKEKGLASGPDLAIPPPLLAVPPPLLSPEAALSLKEREQKPPQTLDAPSTSPVKLLNPKPKMDGEAALADDASVLPVPSHVVLHHLSTSAIRNGVLAVANTTRYRKKVRSRVRVHTIMGRGETMH